jgi:hypothetical protein
VWEQTAQHRTAIQISPQNANLKHNRSADWFSFPNLKRRKHFIDLIFQTSQLSVRDNAKALN